MKRPSAAKVRAVAAMLHRIRFAYAESRALYRGVLPAPDVLTNEAWLTLYGVPWLLEQLAEQGNQQGKGAESQGQPGAHGVWLAQAPVEFVLPKQALAKAASVVMTGHPVAKGFVALLAQLVGVSFDVHVVGAVTVTARHPASTQEVGR